MTPPEITRLPSDGRWIARVIPNRYPALAGTGTTERHGDQMTREMDGLGAHEVVVEAERHDERFEETPPDRLSAVLGVWRERYLALLREPWAKAVVVFKNFGERAGTSLVHPHSQIVALPVVPPYDLHRYAVATRYYDDTGHCVYEHLIESELRARTRVVAERNGFVAVAPFAARLPFETWVVPRERQTSFGQLDPRQLPALAELLRDVIGSLRRAAMDPDYNLVVHSAPVGEETKPFFLWHIRILPRIDTAAGFELGTGMRINSVAPETAAAMLREQLAQAAVG